jgi:hypothetical protein
MDIFLRLIPSRLRNPLGSSSATGLLAVALLTGCGDKAGPQAISIETAPDVVNNAFATAAPDIKQAADKVVSRAAAGDYAGSYFSLEALSSNPDLTPEQRLSLAQTQLAVMEKLNEAAEQGDERAAQAIQTHRARK